MGGFMVYGYPFIALGYTPGVAWGMTALGADQADLFILDTDSQGQCDGTAQSG